MVQRVKKIFFCPFEAAFYSFSYRDDFLAVNTVSQNQCNVMSSLLWTYIVTP